MNDVVSKVVVVVFKEEEEEERKSLVDPRNDGMWGFLSPCDYVGNGGHSDSKSGLGQDSNIIIIFKCELRIENWRRREARSAEREAEKHALHSALRTRRLTLRL